MVQGLGFSGLGFSGLGFSGPRFEVGFRFYFKHALLPSDFNLAAPWQHDQTTASDAVHDAPRRLASGRGAWCASFRVFEGLLKQ